jgi:hypothetical protein
VTDSIVGLDDLSIPDLNVHDDHIHDHDDEDTTVTFPLRHHSLCFPNEILVGDDINGTIVLNPTFNFDLFRDHRPEPTATTTRTIPEISTAGHTNTEHAPRCGRWTSPGRGIIIIPGDD